MILTNVVFVAGDEDGEMSSDADELEVASDDDDDDFEEVDGFEGMDDDFDFAPKQKEQVKKFRQISLRYTKIIFSQFSFLLLIELWTSQVFKWSKPVRVGCLD